MIGKEFSGAVLAAVAAADRRGNLTSATLATALDALAAAEFIHETALYPAVEYAFKHPLTQEVAYRSQLAARRAQVHAAVARATEQLSADKLDEHAALLAYHWEQTEDALTAEYWHARAGRVAGFDSPVEAARHWEKTWEILRSAPSSEAGVALRRQAASQLLLFGWRVGMPGERVAEIFAEGKALAVAVGDVHEQVRLNYSFGLIRALGGDPRRAYPIFDESVVLADATGNPELRWTARTAYEFSLWLAGDLAAAQRMSDEQIALGNVDPALGLAAVGLSTADSYWHRGVILTDVGRFQEAAEAFRCAHERARRFGENEIASWIDCWWVRNLERAGDAAGALSMGRRAIESTEKIGSVLGRGLSYGHYGIACVLSREWQSARENLELALELGRAGQAGHMLDHEYMAALAEAHLASGDERRARQLSEEAIETAVRLQRWVGEVRAQLAHARVLRAIKGADGVAAVRAALDRAQALVDSTGARSYEPQILVERAEIAGLQSDAGGHLHRLREAHRLFAEMGATGHAERVADLTRGTGVWTGSALRLPANRLPANG